MSDFENEMNSEENLTDRLTPSEEAPEITESYTEEKQDEPEAVVNEEVLENEAEDEPIAVQSETKDDEHTAYQDTTHDEPTPGVVLLTPGKKKKSAKKLVAILAGAAVIGCSIGIGAGAGSYINRVGGISVTPGSDLSLEYGDNSSETMPIEYTTNFTGIKDIFKEVQGSIVNISMKVSATNMWFETYEATGSGSGIIYKIDGNDVYIVTNNHVVEGANTVSVSVTGEEQVNATLVGRDAQNDLAVIKVSKADLTAAGVTDIKAVEFVKEDTYEIGETVLAIGNALGEGKSITQGILSAKDKNVKIDGKSLTVLQTDAAVNPGNSGGALVNLDAKVIGINTAKIGSTTVEGTGYAIPSYIAVGIVDQIIEKGTVEKPYLGIVCFTITDSFKQMYNIDINGVFIREVEADSAAQKAGLVASDIITAVNGTPIASQEDLSKVIAGAKVGDSLKIDYIRNGQEKKTTTAVLENYNEAF